MINLKINATGTPIYLQISVKIFKYFRFVVWGQCWELSGWVVTLGLRSIAQGWVTTTPNSSFDIDINYSLWISTFEELSFNLSKNFQNLDHLFNQLKVSKPMWVNSDYIQYGVSLLMLGGLPIIKKFVIFNTLIS